jgi:hypothetical protein
MVLLISLLSITFVQAPRINIELSLIASISDKSSEVSMLKKFFAFTVKPKELEISIINHFS